MDRAELVSRFPGYRWLVEHGIGGWEPFTSLQPWHFVVQSEMFYVTDIFPNGPHDVPLLAFARRQDCDDVACFSDNPAGPTEVVVIEWHSRGYDVVAVFPTFWDWFKSVVDDIAEWSSRATNAA